jgi:hypothetical protein
MAISNVEIDAQIDLSPHTSPKQPSKGSIKYGCDYNDTNGND